MRPTQEQQQAIYIHDKNLIVTAGAGSGKTRVLVERFVSLLEANPSWALPAVVAITFTEKAAREMRDRLSQTIEKRLTIALEAHDVQQVQFWRQHQNSLDSARISTIHSLCAQILRANPVEAGLDPRFTVVDEINANLMIREAVDVALSQIVEERHPAIALLTAYEVRIVRQTLQAFATQSAAQPLLDILAEKDSAALLSEWDSHWRSYSQDLLVQIQQNEDLRTACAWIDQIDPLQVHEDKLWPAWQRVIEHREAFFNTTDVEEFGRIAEELADTNVFNLRRGSKKYWGDDLLPICKNYLTQIRETAKAFLEERLAPPQASDAEWLLLWRDAVALVVEHYQGLKAEAVALDFDDLEHRTRDVLERFPAVAQRYADPISGEFRHVMVDEFQDTNDNQRRIVYALTGIDPRQNRAHSGRLFVVGDPKQSIYAFRGADVSVFSQVRDELLASGGESLVLSRSFRSHENLVALFNAVFSDRMQVQQGAMADFFVRYDAMNAFRSAEDYHTVPIKLLIVAKADENLIHVDASIQRRHEAYRIAQEIYQMVAAQTPVWDKAHNHYRPMQYGDVALLFQSMNHASLYEQAFQAQDIPYMTVAGKGYFEQQEVWDMMNVLRVLHRPYDDLALASVLRSPFFALSDDGLLALRLRHDDAGKVLSLWEALFADELHPDWPPIEDPQDEASIVAAQNFLLNLHEHAGRVSIAELLHDILEESTIEATLSALPNGTRRRANILKLIEVARQSNSISLSDFSELLRDMVSTEAREGEATLENDNVVLLMSVHKSKGLEFPVVVLPDSNWQRTAYYDTLFVDPHVGPVCKIPNEDDPSLAKSAAYAIAHSYAQERDFAERLRLLYVAMTRAQDYLLVSGSLGKKRDFGGRDWLSQLWQALGLDAAAEAFLDDRGFIVFPWGELALEVEVLSDEKLRQSRQLTETLRFEWPNIPAAAVTENPFPLVARPDIHLPGERLHIQATDLERFGRIPYENPESAAQADFRQHLLADLPGPIRPALQFQDGETKRNLVKGNLVHHALQLGLLPDRMNKADLLDILSAYLWEEGIANEWQRQQIAKDVLNHELQQFTHSPLARMLERARAVYREIAFVLEYKPYVIHGIIDLLFRSAEDVWVVVDYKTGRPSHADIAQHSERYVYQLGAYALAVEAQTGTAPKIGIQYLIHTSMEPHWVPEATWRAAMASLDKQLTDTLNPNKG